MGLAAFRRAGREARERERDTIIYGACSKEENSFGKSVKTRTMRARHTKAGHKQCKCISARNGRRFGRRAPSQTSVMRRLRSNGACSYLHYPLTGDRLTHSPHSLRPPWRPSSHYIFFFSLFYAPPLLIPSISPSLGALDQIEQLQI